MQEKAKLWADTNTVKVIFVNNDEKTEAILQNNSSCWSRVATPIIVEDLEYEEAVEYLTAEKFMEQELVVNSGSSNETAARGSLPPETAGQIVDLVGGRILHLIEFKRAWYRGVEFEEMARELKDREREQLLKVFYTLKCETHLQIV